MLGGPDGRTLFVMAAEWNPTDRSAGRAPGRCSPFRPGPARRLALIRGVRGRCRPHHRARDRPVGENARVDERLTGAITLPDGTPVRGRGRREPLPSGPRPQFGLYLGRPPAGPGSVGRGPRWRPEWPAEWIDWPDFRTPRDDRAAARLIGDLPPGPDRGAGGGRLRRRRRPDRHGDRLPGRAGRAPGGRRGGWTRRNYRPRAVETPGQRRWVAWFAEHGRRDPAAAG